MFNRALSVFFLFTVLVTRSFGQSEGGKNGVPDNQTTTYSNQSLSKILTLTDCLNYALKNQPAVNQAQIDEAVARTNNSLALSGWLPQVYGSANLLNYFKLPTAFTTVNGKLTPVASGVFNYSTPSITASQNIFSTDVLFAMKASRLNVEESKLAATATKIELVSAVAKAFYELLLSQAQTGVYREDTARLTKNRTDAYNRYVSGISDKVDYKQASISLNNSLSQLNIATEAVAARYAYLKQLMGCPETVNFAVRFDTARMMQESTVDTNVRLQFERRIEYRMVENIMRLQHESTSYYKTGFLPSLSANYTYNHQFASNTFSDLYSKAYPYSFVGLQLNVPIFAGFRRTENVHKAELAETRADWDMINLKLSIYTQYKQALASYKSNSYNLIRQRENEDMAREVYNIVKLQYREGIKPYLDVIVAESDLQTSQIGYLNALFHLLESKVDLEKAMGNLTFDNLN